MKKGFIALIIIGLLAMLAWRSYNGLVGKDEGVNKAWANVQDQYQRRMDLINNLVATVKGAANFEQKTLTDVIEARAKATQMQVNAADLTPEKIQAFQAAQGQLSQALGRLMMITENYPQLKANQNFLDLQTQIEGTENRCSAARTEYNEVVQAFNTSARSFPTILFANLFNMKAKPPFKAEDAAQKAPQVQF